MRPFERATTIPPQGEFKLSKETYEYIDLLKGMEPGEIFKFPTDDAQTIKQQVDTLRLIKDRLVSAAKRTENDGQYKICSRSRVVFVKRIV